MKKYEKSVQFMKNFRIRETLNLLACAVSSTDIIKNPKKIGTQNIKKISHLSHVLCHLSPVTCHLSPVTCHLSTVTCYLSPVTCPMSPVVCHLSPVTCHMSLMQTASATDIPLANSSTMQNPIAELQRKSCLPKSQY